MRNPNVSAVVATFVALLVIGVYWTGLHGAFFFDDGPSILFAPGVKLGTLSTEALSQAWLSGSAGPTGRPVSQLSFALNYYSTGFDPFAFKATNLAIHLVCGAFVFNLTRQLLAQAQQQALLPTQRHALVASGAVAALWLLHPIQLLPVLHVVQRMTSLSTLFLLAAFSAHIGGRERSGRSGAALLLCAWGLLWPLSVLSKETGLLFPVFVLAWELILRRSKFGRLDRFARIFRATVVLVLFMAVAYSVLPSGQWIWSGYGMRSFTLVDRLLTEARVVWVYLSLIVTPQLASFGLYHDDIVVSTSLLSPWTTLSSMLGLVSLVWFGWWSRKRMPLVAFGIAWFLIGHSMESTVLPLEIAHEHRNYLPLLGVLVAALGIALRAIARGGVPKQTALALMVVVLIYFSFVTALRAHQFGDEVRRTQVEVQHHPASARAQYEAGSTLSSLPEAARSTSVVYATARSSLVLASQIDPNMKVGLLGIVDLNCRAGLPMAKAELDELSRRLRETPFSPGDRNVLYGLKETAIAGSICYARSDVDRLFLDAIANPSVSLGVRSILHSWHADYLWLREHDIVAAHAALEQSLALNPSNLSNRLKWAQLILLSGDRERAWQQFLALKDQHFSAQERETLNELLAAVNMPNP